MDRYRFSTLISKLLSGDRYITDAVSGGLHVIHKLRSDPPEVESAFLAGILHDLGKVVLDRCFADYYRSVLDQVQTTEMPIFQAEKEILGLTHTDVGGQLATEWKFSENYLNAILYHHNPGGNRRYARLTCLVHLADVICRQLGYGSGGDNEVPTIDQSVMDRFTLRDREIQILVEASEQDLENADSFLSALAN